MIGFYAFAVVLDGDDQVSGAVFGGELNGSVGGFAEMGAIVGGFDAMVDGVAEEVGEGGFEVVEDVAIDVGVFADDFEFDLFVNLPCEVANHAGKTNADVAEGAHLAVDDFLVEAVGELVRSAGVFFEFGGAIQEMAAAVVGLVPGLAEDIVEFWVGGGELGLEAVKEFDEVGLLGF